MKKKIKRIGTLASGGDTPGMNAATRAIVKVAEREDIEVFGIQHGFRGLVEGRIMHLDGERVYNIGHKGGTILKTSRYKEFMQDEGQIKAVAMARAYDLDGLITIGGDGTMRGAASLCALGLPTITLPGTIDNDLAYTDYTIGFDTAVNGVISEIIKVRDTMVSHDRIGIVEVMGNKCGDIALYAGLAGAMDYILLPEKPFDIDAICSELTKKSLKGQYTSMIIIAEGVGKGEDIAQYIREHTHLDIKSVVLGYTQRGGSPTARDRSIAARLGERAVKLLANGTGNRAVGIRGEEIVDMDIMEALEAPKVFRDDLYELAYTLTR
jgi:6-phosphofructokinase 1